MIMQRASFCAVSIARLICRYMRSSFQRRVAQGLAHATG